MIIIIIITMKWVEQRNEIGIKVKVWITRILVSRILRCYLSNQKRTFLTPFCPLLSSLSFSWKKRREKKTKVKLSMNQTELYCEQIKVDNRWRKKRSWPFEKFTFTTLSLKLLANNEGKLFISNEHWKVFRIWNDMNKHWIEQIVNVKF